MQKYFAKSTSLFTGAGSSAMKWFPFAIGMSDAVGEGEEGCSSAIKWSPFAVGMSDEIGEGEGRRDFEIRGGGNGIRACGFLVLGSGKQGLLSSLSVDFYVLIGKMAVNI